MLCRSGKSGLLSPLRRITCNVQCGSAHHDLRTLPNVSVHKHFVGLCDDSYAIDFQMLGAELFRSFFDTAVAKPKPQQSFGDWAAATSEPFDVKSNFDVEPNRAFGAAGASTDLLLKRSSLLAAISTQTGNCAFDNIHN